MLVFIFQYIVSKGKLQVISEDGKIVLATLKAGSYFGEISILNMGEPFENISFKTSYFTLRIFTTIFNFNQVPWETDARPVLKVSVTPTCFVSPKRTYGRC